MSSRGREFQFQLRTMFGLVALLACLLTVHKALGMLPMLGIVGVMIVVFILSLMRDYPRRD